MTTLAETEPSTTLGIFTLLSGLSPSPLNPRKRFAAAEMADLQANIEKHGVIVPLIVRRKVDVIPVVEVVDGERRYRAAKAADLQTVPVVFRDELTDSEVIEIQLLSAIQRQDLTPLEEAGGFKALIDSNASRYSAAYIADRIGRSEKWVWDRMKLLDLVPVAKQLLEAELILVGHAEVLAKLKPEDQLRAIGETDRDYGGIEGGVFQRAESRFGFEDPTGVDEDDVDAAADAQDPIAIYRNYKAKTVKELEAWISRHVRFDVQHAAAVAPLDFGDAALKVEEATAAPGRGKKVVEITYEYQVPPDTRGEARMLAARAWKKADGSEGASTCEYSVLGVVAAGRGYGRTFEVCIAKDKCTTHWKDEIKAKEKSDQLRAKGQGGRASQNEAVDNAKAREKHEREQRERQARQQQWQKLEPFILTEAIDQAKKFKALTAAHAKALNNIDAWNMSDQLKKHLGATWFKQPVAAFVVLLVTSTGVEDFDDYVKEVAKPAGLDIKRLEAVRDKQLGTKAAAPAKAIKKGKKR